MKKRGLERMGIYLNPNGEAFEIAVQSDIYVDKTGMLLYLCGTCLHDRNPPHKEIRHTFGAQHV